jgi:hypothetical protein
MSFAGRFNAVHGAIRHRRHGILGGREIPRGFIVILSVSGWLHSLSISGIE